jgi:hypothetical protein
MPWRSVAPDVLSWIPRLSSAPGTVGRFINHNDVLVLKDDFEIVYHVCGYF